MWPAFMKSAVSRSHWGRFREPLGTVPNGPVFGNFYFCFYFIISRWEWEGFLLRRWLAIWSIPRYPSYRKTSAENGGGPLGTVPNGPVFGNFYFRLYFIISRWEWGGFLLRRWLAISPPVKRFGTPVYRPRTIGGRFKTL